MLDKRASVRARVVTSFSAPTSVWSACGLLQMEALLAKIIRSAKAIALLQVNVRLTDRSSNPATASITFQME